MGNQEEIWRDIVGYEGIYRVSNLGNVKSLDRVVECLNRGKYLVQRTRKGVPIAATQSKKYLKVGLTKDGKPSWKLVHKLVANAFIENKEGLKCINHINGLHRDNRVENLEWCTHAYNSQHAYDNGLASAWNKKVVVNLENGVFYDKSSDAALAHDIPPSTMRGRLNGSQKKHPYLIYA